MSLPASIIEATAFKSPPATMLVLPFTLPTTEEAQQKKDLQTLQALLGAPSYLSGLTDIEVQHYTRQLHEIQNPALAQRLKVMKNAATLLGERGGLVFREVEKAVGKPSHVIQKLRKAKNEAEQAFILKDQRVDL